MTKKIKRIIAIAIILTMIVSAGAFALEDASAYIVSKGGGITATGGGNMRITFSMIATGMMDKLGASAIDIYNDDGILVHTILHTDPGCSNMMTENNYSYGSSVNWEGISGESYYAIIAFYATDDTGYDYRTFVTTTVQV